MHSRLFVKKPIENEDNEVALMDENEKSNEESNEGNGGDDEGSEATE